MNSFTSIMKLLTDKLTLERFLYLVSFDTKQIKKGNVVYTQEEALQHREDLILIHTYFAQSDASFSPKVRLSILGKCSGQIPYLTKLFNLPRIKGRLLDTSQHYLKSKK